MKGVTFGAHLLSCNKLLKPKHTPIWKCNGQLPCGAPKSRPSHCSGVVGSQTLQGQHSDGRGQPLKALTVTAMNAENIENVRNFRYADRTGARM